MAKNVIYYGPPATGKTYLMQQLQNNYTDYAISDQQIREAFIKSSREWVPVTLILLQHRNSLSSAQIQTVLDRLQLNGFNMAASTVLASHSLSLENVFTPRQPQIFQEDTQNKWSVHYPSLLAHDKKFFDKFVDKEAVNYRFEFVTFHQSFVYEDFIEGIRPNVANTNNGNITYSIQDGIFKRICKRATEDPTNEYAIFIDEINRGNIEGIFGELISLIELDKRIGNVNPLSVTLPYSKESFGVPNNLSIFGTMNSADKSTDIMDIALRRRFEFIPMNYNLDELSTVLRHKGIDPTNIDGIDLLTLLKTINERITLLLDNNFTIGHAYFTNVSSFADIKDVLIHKIIPLLEEYFYEDLGKIQLIFSDIDTQGQNKADAIMTYEELVTESLFEYIDDIELIENKKTYAINYSFDRNSVIKIYS